MSIDCDINEVISPDAVVSELSLLKQVLSHPETEVRRGVTAALGRVGRQRPNVVAETVPAVADLLSDADLDVRANAVGMLGEVAPVVPERVGNRIQKLLSCLNDDGALVRRNAARTIGILAREEPSVFDSDDVDRLGSGFGYPDPDLRAHLVGAVGHLADAGVDGTCRLLPAVASALYADHERLRGNGAASLNVLVGECPSNASVGIHPAYRLTRREDQADSAYDVLTSIIGTLDREPPGQDQSIKSRLSDQSDEDRREAAAEFMTWVTSITGMSVRPAGKNIRQLTHTDEAIRASAAHALGDQLSEFAVVDSVACEALVDCLSDPAPLVREHASSAVGRIAVHHPDLFATKMDELSQGLSDDHQSVRVSTVASLGTLANRRPAALASVVSDLVDRFDDVRRVREAATVAVEQLTESRADLVVEHLSELERKLSDESPQVRATAAEVFAEVASSKFGDTTSHLPALVDAVADSERTVRTNATGAIATIARYHPHSVGGYLDSLADRRTDQSPGVRRNVSAVYLHLATEIPTTVSAQTKEIAAFLTDVDADCRYNGAEALAQLASANDQLLEPLVEDLIETLPDLSLETQASVVKALRATDTEYVVSKVARDPGRVVSVLREHYEESVLRDCLVVLRRVAEHDPGSLAPYRSTIMDVGEFRADTVRMESLTTLVEVGGVVSPLRQSSVSLETGRSG